MLLLRLSLNCKKMEQIKNVIVWILAAVGSYFAPIQSIFLGVVWVFALNFLFGLLNGLIVKDEDFSLKKACICFLEATVLFVLMSSIFFVGEKIGNPSGALQCITGIVYALIYFYSVNILRNIKGIFPDNRLIAFLYMVVSIEFVKKIPYLATFTEKEVAQNGKC